MSKIEAANFLDEVVEDIKERDDRAWGKSKPNFINKRIDLITAGRDVLAEKFILIETPVRPFAAIDKYPVSENGMILGKATPWKIVDPRREDQLLRIADLLVLGTNELHSDGIQIQMLLEREARKIYTIGFMHFHNWLDESTNLERDYRRAAELIEKIAAGTEAKL